MAQLAQIYIGYKDRRFVPFRCLKDVTLYNAKYAADENLVKQALCVAQKIGRGAGGCFIVEMPRLQRIWADRLKRNHYVFCVTAEVADDMDCYNKFIERKLGHPPGHDPFRSVGTSNAPRCDLGFCDV